MVEPGARPQRHTNMRLPAVLLVIVTLLGACSTSFGGSSDESVPSQAEAAPAIWPVGPEFTATEFTQDGVIREHPVKAQSFTNSSVGLDLGVCGYGGGMDYRITDGRFVMNGFSRDDIGCEPEDPIRIANAETLESLFSSGPTVSIGDDHIEVENDGVRLVLTTDNPEANQTVIPIEIRYHGVSSNDSLIDPSQVTLIQPAFFVINFQLESCLAHGQVGELGGEGPRDVIVGVDPIDCPDPTPSDQAVLDLLNAQPTMTYADSQLTITAPDGTNLVLESD